MTPNKENTLNVTIGKAEFDLIERGVQKNLFREITDRNFKKHLLYDYTENLLYVAAGAWHNTEKEPDDILLYNEGTYPFLPTEYKFVTLATGSKINRKTMTVEVKDVSFFAATDSTEKVIRLKWSERIGFVPDNEGELASWFVVYHLGNRI
ncbi:hypothetical protein M2132_001699 [Dysgonomonas sp. PH5-45]|uniref:hypothetical protein n=1 Tax=unclassified Dysgonomonas TaxID=2630389 RepID=UPI0024733803|nr:MULTISPECIES: hypothetical protein [unclassified Dysgonomonas]MDH6355358.1 hypothetical protein [Dysgonomonas sp. PH5-45]MDH6388256.1 hypothetical protein [Dysgonomonas sp. PH5-37]